VGGQPRGDGLLCEDAAQGELGSNKRKAQLAVPSVLYAVLLLLTSCFIAWLYAHRAQCVAWCFPPAFSDIDTCLLLLLVRFAGHPQQEAHAVHRVKQRSHATPFHRLRQYRIA
jgi:hypothetical protein